MTTNLGRLTRVPPRHGPGCLSKTRPSLQILLRRPSSSLGSGVKQPEFTAEERDILDAMMRVDQAGELGANWIYRGQLAVFGRDPKLGPMIKHMWDQEKVHLEKFDQLVGHHRARPSILRPLWQASGYMLGVSTALMGREAAMACTEAVETVIGHHYNDQIRELLKFRNQESVAELKEIIKKFRDDELEHLDTAVQEDAHQAPMYKGMSTLIQAGCKAAIWIAQRF